MKLLLFEIAFFGKIYINILALKMASPGNRHCASCIGTLSFPTASLSLIPSTPLPYLSVGFAALTPSGAINLHYIDHLRRIASRRNRIASFSAAPRSIAVIAITWRFPDEDNCYKAWAKAIIIAYSSSIGYYTLHSSLFLNRHRHANDTHAASFTHTTELWLTYRFVIFRISLLLHALECPMLRLHAGQPGSE